MCTPIGHTLLGGALFFSSRKASEKTNWLIFGIVIILANLPDIDFFFGAVRGNPNMYHHYWTHSFGFALIGGMLLSVICRGFSMRDSLKFGVLAFFLIFTHVVLDFFTKDTGYPYGVPLLWPISEGHYISPMSIFQDVNKASSSRAFIGSLFCWHNLWTIVREVVILGPLSLISWLLFRKRKSNHGGP